MTRGDVIASLPSLGLLTVAALRLDARWQPSRIANRGALRQAEAKPEAVRFAMMFDAGLPLSPRKTADLLHERGVDVSK